MKRVVVAGGGTGGHLFPGLAVVEELRRRFEDVEVLFVGTERGIEARVLPPRGERVEFIGVSPLKGKSPLERLSSVAKLPAAGAQSLGILRRFRPDVVLGVGGYASGPLLAAALASGVRTAVLEQNAHVGLTNRTLARWVGRAYLSFPETLSVFPGASARLVGNPVRRAIVEAAQLAAFAGPDGAVSRRSLLVLGGSQGSRALNETVPELLARVQNRGVSFRVVHQTGEAMRSEVERRYQSLGVGAEVVSFIDDMAAAYGASDLVLGRAGATTVAELTALGRPSVLVPYPHAADDHQRKNAEALARAGAAACVLEPDLGSLEAEALVARLLEEPAARAEMARRARALGKPEAAADIVDDLSEWLGFESPRGGEGERSRSGSVRSPAGKSGLRMRADGARPYRPERASWAPPRRSSVPPHMRLPLEVVDTSSVIE